MKILHTVEHYHPHIGGSEEVVRQISERLVERGHSVTVATGFEPSRKASVLNGVQIVAFKNEGNLALGFSGEDQRRYQAVASGGNFDVVMNYATQNWTTDLLLPVLNEIKAVKVIVPCGYSGLNQPVYHRYFQKLHEYLNSYDQIIYMSPNYQDKRYGDMNGLEKYTIIPNGADLREFTTPPLAFRNKFKIKTPFMLLCVANFYRSKGHLLVIEAVQQLGREDATLVLIGNAEGRRPKLLQKYYLQIQARALMHKGIKIFEAVERNWVVSAFKETDIFVFGSQVECAPLVIQEAMASGTPFISTSCGDVPEYREFGRLVENTEEMSKAINSLLDNDSLRQRLGEAARKDWLGNRTWDSITDKYEALYKQLLRKRNLAPST